MDIFNNEYILKELNKYIYIYYENNFFDKNRLNLMNININDILLFILCIMN